ncbi:MAG TPA: hypothetical protein VGT44_00175 [Ktedonobacteraceae bacterium]|nr:hypothetical protein [Ktedonobacteraceae bacterium]
MQQQELNYDLLAVFGSETDADAAAVKLTKEGFGDDEVFRMTGDSVTSGEFRDHGPNRNRSEVFLQTSRSGPNPVSVIALALLFGVLIGGIMFGAAEFTTKLLPIVPSTVAGAAVGIILGAVLGLLQRGRERGNIGQDRSRQAAAQQNQGARTVIAVRLSNAENISRKSKARAILINNNGRIDRSVGREV